MIENRIKFITEYMKDSNAASASKFDANANVENKNIATLSTEVTKYENIMTNREMIKRRIAEMYGEELGEEYVRQINDHEIYVHDETSLLPYCVSINMFPFLKHGLKELGGESKAPTNLNSYCGSFINLVFAVASQFAGAVATVEFLMYFDYFARKDFGEDYYLHLQDVVYKTASRELTVENMITQYFQQVVYSINQPAAARGYQSVFWNISIFDEQYFDSIFGDFRFLDMTAPKWDSLNQLQQLFMNWFNDERRKAVLTFPVVTAALLTDKEDVVDNETGLFISDQLSKGNSFFIYMSDSADSLASCCRLRNELSDNTFSYSLGAGGVSTGSINVITINVNRVVQKGIAIEDIVSKVQKYHIAFRSLIQDYKDAGLLPVYDAGFITLDKQFSTIGINGMVEAAEFKGVEISNNDEYFEFIDSILKPIYDANKQAKAETGFMFNTEFVPGENLGVKNAAWDRRDNLFVPRDTYNSYFYIVEDESINAIDKFKLHGDKGVRYLDGGSALHLNMDDHLNAEQYRELLKVAARNGCNYWTINVKNTICNECDTIDKSTLDTCPKCGSENIDYATRVIGYLKRVSSFSEPRQGEESIRNYHEKH